jgi:CRISPR-associated protein Cas5t
MLSVYVSVPIACFRKRLAREYLETEPLPPPATCYGFLLSLVGEMDRRRHAGVRVCPVLLNRPETSVVLRTVWRVKKTPLGSPGNTRPDYQQLLSPIQLLIWIESADEAAPTSLEQRVLSALSEPASVNRFGGLSLGESTHLVDEVSPFQPRHSRFASLPAQGQAFLLAERGRLSLPVWVDHVGSAGTRFVTGDLTTVDVANAPAKDLMPRIEPH